MSKGSLASNLHAADKTIHLILKVALKKGMNFNCKFSSYRVLGKNFWHTNVEEKSSFVGRMYICTMYIEHIFLRQNNFRYSDENKFCNEDYLLEAGAGFTNFCGG
jgi:hypothetical protein